MKYLALLLILAILAGPGQASPAAARAPEGPEEASAFTAFKLEAYRRRDVAWNFSLADSVFAYSIRGQRRALEQGAEGLRPASGRWQKCPSGFRSGLVRISLELPAGHPASLTLRLQNRRHELLAERVLDGLREGRIDIEISLPEELALAGFSNPCELLLSLPQDGSAGRISEIIVDSQCQAMGWHRFADFDTSETEFQPGQRIILF